MTLNIYDVRGRQVRSLVHGILAAGSYRHSWDFSDDQGQGVASGIYIVRLAAGDKILNEKVVVTR